MNLAKLEASVLAAVTTKGPASHSLLNSIKPARGIGAEERIEAYRANVWGAHLGALDHAFPVTREVLGAHYWHQLLQEGIEAFNTSSHDLHAFGEFVPELLQRARQHHPELNDFPYLGDLAMMEWHVHSTRFACDDLHFDWIAFNTLAQDLQSRATLRLNQALMIFRSSYPVDVIWHAHQATGEATLESVSPLACCIHRIKRFDVTVTRLSYESAKLLVAIADGISLDKLSVAVGAKQPEAIVRQLYDWIQRDWIVDFEVR